jgi:type I restriction enzyme S subunit
VWNGEIGDCIHQNHIFRARLHPAAVEPRFVSWHGNYFGQSWFTQAGKQTTNLASINKSILRQFPVPVAPLNEQRRIADRIDELFTDLAAGVAALERVRRNLKRYRSAVLHAALTGRLTAAWRAQHGPPDEPGPKLLERVLAERRQHWEERALKKYAKAGKQPPKNWRQRYPEPVPPKPADLPVLPDDWCWATQDQVGDVQLGRQRSPQHHSGRHMRPYLRVANVYEDRIDTADVLRMNFTPNEFATYALRNGDILLNEGQSIELVGRPAMYQGEVAGSCFQNTLVRQRVFDGVLADYAFLAIRAQFRGGRYRQIARITTSIAHLGAERFAAVEFPLPPVREQATIVEAVQERWSQIDALEAEVDRGLARSARLRQSILKAAFEGKLVANDPNDEPASVLLARLKTEATAGAAASQANANSRAIGSKRRSRKSRAQANGDAPTLFKDMHEGDAPKGVRRRKKR